ncbi:MAG: hypothetical protein WC091_23235 [Sulfuricellaceae bacterium]
MNLESCLTRLAQLIGAENKQIDQRLSALERRFDLAALPRADASLPEHIIVRQSGAWRVAGLAQMQEWMKAKKEK